MRKITICNGKGGSGKTTATILLGLALTEAGHKARVIDADPQSTATRWIADGGLPLDSGDNSATTLIDTPPRLDDKNLRRAIQESDNVIVISSPSPADLFTSQDTAKLIASLRATKRARLLFNQVQEGTILSRGLEETAQRIGLVPLKSVLMRRQCYQHAVLLGWNALPARAKEEVLKVALEVASL
ncbi:MAG TPA: ParA family protein [Pyrinomonadaceae bacterium]|nr:ParA family protein [Pyrinomonadaceae bacterium]